MLRNAQRRKRRQYQHTPHKTLSAVLGFAALERSSEGSCAKNGSSKRPSGALSAIAEIYKSPEFAAELCDATGARSFRQAVRDVALQRRLPLDKPFPIGPFVIHARRVKRGAQLDWLCVSVCGDWNAAEELAALRDAHFLEALVRSFLAHGRLLDAKLKNVQLVFALLERLFRKDCGSLRLCDRDFLGRALREHADFIDSRLHRSEFRTQRASRHSGRTFPEPIPRGAPRQSSADASPRANLPREWDSRQERRDPSKPGAQGKEPALLREAGDKDQRQPRDEYGPVKSAESLPMPVAVPSIQMAHLPAQLPMHMSSAVPVAVPMPVLADLATAGYYHWPAAPFYEEVAMPRLAPSSAHLGAAPYVVDGRDNENESDSDIQEWRLYMQDAGMSSGGNMTVSPPHCVNEEGTDTRAAQKQPGKKQVLDKECEEQVKSAPGRDEQNKENRDSQDAEFERHLQDVTRLVTLIRGNGACLSTLWELRQALADFKGAVSRRVNRQDQKNTHPMPPLPVCS